MLEMAKMIWNGATSQTGASTSKGISMSEVVSYLNSDWSAV
jgi:hypothetical protein